VLRAVGVCVTWCEAGHRGNDSLVDHSAFYRVLSILVEFGLEQETRNHARPAQGLNERFTAGIEKLPNKVPELRLEGKRHSVVGKGAASMALAAPGGPEVGVLQGEVGPLEDVHAQQGIRGVRAGNTRPLAVRNWGERRARLARGQEQALVGIGVCESVIPLEMTYLSKAMALRRTGTPRQR